MSGMRIAAIFQNLLSKPLLQLGQGQQPFTELPTARPGCQGDSQGNPRRDFLLQGGGRSKSRRGRKVGTGSEKDSEA